VRFDPLLHPHNFWMCELHLSLQVVQEV